MILASTWIRLDTSLINKFTLLFSHAFVFIIDVFLSLSLTARAKPFVRLTHFQVIHFWGFPIIPVPFLLKFYYTHREVLSIIQR